MFRAVCPVASLCLSFHICTMRRVLVLSCGPPVRSARERAGGGVCMLDVSSYSVFPPERQGWREEFLGCPWTHITATPTPISTTHCHLLSEGLRSRPRPPQQPCFLIWHISYSLESGQKCSPAPSVSLGWKEAISPPPGLDPQGALPSPTACHSMSRLQAPPFAGTKSEWTQEEAPQARGG